MIMGNQNLDSAQLSQILSESTHVLSKLPPDFEKIFQLDKILTSAFFELKGLLCFAIVNATQIKSLCEKSPVLRSYVTILTFYAQTQDSLKTR